MSISITWYDDSDRNGVGNMVGGGDRHNAGDGGLGGCEGWGGCEQVKSVYAGLL